MSKYKFVYFIVSPFFKIGVLLWKLIILVSVALLILSVGVFMFLLVLFALLLDGTLLCFTTKPPSKPRVNFRDIYEDTLDFWVALTNNL